MEKLIFANINQEKSKTDWNVRIDEQAYREVQTISEKTGLSLKTVLSAMVKFALQHTEVVG